MRRRLVAIHFYSTTGPYGGFSNFSHYGFELDGAYWPTSEHYFQAQIMASGPFEYVQVAP